MEKKRNQMTERILDLTLEIIYLLTGEDYGPIKKVSDPRRPSSMIFKKESEKKILEVTQKIIQLLTGEVPIRCQDVTVYFSMEEWEYIEEHKDLYKDVMMANRPPLTSPDGSSNRNPPERCPSPLYSRDSTQEHQEIPQEDQKENLSESKIEGGEEETSFRDDERSDEEEIPSDKQDRCSSALYSGDLKDDYKILQDYHGEPFVDIKVVVKEEEEEELHVRGDEPYNEKEIPPEISTDGSSNRNSPERCPCPLYSWDSTREHQEIPQEDQEENLSESRIEGGEEDTSMRDDERSEEKAFSPATQDRCTSPLFCGDLQDYQVENLIGIEVKIKEEGEELYGSGDDGIPPEISTGGPQSRNYENRRYIFAPYGNTEDDLIEDSSGRNSMSLFLHPGPRMTDLSLDKGNFPGHSLPITHRAGGDMFPFSEHREHFVKEEELIIDQSSHSLTGTYSHSNYEDSFIQNCFLQRHQSNHAWGHPYSCTECGKGFKLKSAFIRHKRTHTEERPFSCTECGKSFSQRAHLVSHERIHTGVKPYCCSECGKCFSHKISLITHESFHTGVKPFFCTECGKQFSRKSVLILHERVHTGEKPYPCPECGKCFSQRTHLNTHRRSHTSERPFSCSECGKTYSRKSYLVDHLRTHTGVKPYSCSVCGKCFSCKSNLITHQTIHSSKKPFSCAQCGKSFQTRSAFTYHKKLHAADKLPLC